MLDVYPKSFILVAIFFPFGEWKLSRDGFIFLDTSPQVRVDIDDIQLAKEMVLS
jgi:hypothetical protein